MASATLSADALVELALSKGVPLGVRLTLIAAERANAGLIAEFDRLELVELLTEAAGEGITRSSAQRRSALRGAIHVAVTAGYLIEGSDMRRLILNPEHFTVAPTGLRKVADLDSGRVLLECGDCSTRRVYAAERFTEGTCTCACSMTIRKNR